MLFLIVRYLLALAFIPCVGYPLTLWLVGARLGWSQVARWALAWAAGLGVISLEMLSLGLLGQSLTLANVVIPTAAIAGLLWVSYRCRYRANGSTVEPNASRPWNWLDKGLVFIIVFQILFSAVAALYLPLNTADAWGNWGLKGKAFFLEQALTFENLYERHGYYPLLVPLSLTWVYLGLGQINDGLVKAIFTLNLLALVALFYQFMRLAAFKRREALLATAYLTLAGGMLIRHSAVAQADVPLGLFYGLACLSFVAWTQQPEQIRYLAITGLGAGLSVWTKYEGLPHVVILTAVAGLFVALNWRRRQFPLAFQMLSVYILPIAVGLLPWLAFRQLHNLVSDGEHLGMLQVDQLPAVIRTMGLALVDIQRWGILWPVLGLTLLLNWRDLRRKVLFYPSLLLGLNLAFYVVAYLATSHVDLAAQINNTIHRLLLHIAPLTIFVVVLCVRSWFDNQRKFIAVLPPVVEGALRLTDR
ncbi:MAG TPA: hypothetical protein VJG32_05060 [Anaerolineae bacterium]|nr:hypothetical protein [Anaerolineae bacterium]